MTLKFKRNLPLLLLLVSILSFMALTMGSQQIVSYTVNTDALPTVQLPGFFNSQNTDAGLHQFSNVQP